MQIFAWIENRNSSRCTDFLNNKPDIVMATRATIWWLEGQIMQIVSEKREPSRLNNSE